MGMLMNISVCYTSYSFIKTPILKKRVLFCESPYNKKSPLKKGAFAFKNTNYFLAFLTAA